MRSLIGLFAALLAFGLAITPARAADCDRDCLLGVMKTYLAALAARDPSLAPIAVNAKFVENAARIPVGEGLWYGAGPSSHDLALVAADAQAGQVGYLGALSENDKPIILVLRLKVADGKITEIEHRVERGLAPHTVAALHTAEIFKTPLRDSERVPRGELFRIADSYFDALEKADSSLAPFDEAVCERYESAERTTKSPMRAERLAGMSQNDITFWTEYRKLGCGGQIDTNALRHINALDPRRILILDEEAGLVFSYPTFVHKGDIQTVEIKNVPGVTSLVFPTPPGDTHAGEVFKIRGGKIVGVQVSGARLPYGTKTGWE
jgi:hypothetical protein